MSKIITIKLTKASSKTGPFDITDQAGNIIASGVSKDILKRGISYRVDDAVSIITLTSSGKCEATKTKRIGTFTTEQLISTLFVASHTGCVWRHLTAPDLFNSYYGTTEPYVIEYPFSYSYFDEILQSVQCYSKVYKYLPDDTGMFSYADKIEVDDAWFNKAVIYNNQQSSGILELVAKPINNLRAYMQYPIYSSDSKKITYTKSDNFYQYNTFWNILKDKKVPLFINSCESLSIDKVVNQNNMDYTYRSFRKDTLRAKDIKVRHILDNRSDIHIVSQFITNSSQISYK